MNQLMMDYIAGMLALLSLVLLVALGGWVMIKWIDEPFERFDDKCQSVHYSTDACLKFISNLNPTDPIVLNAKKNGWIQ